MRALVIEQHGDLNQVQVKQLAAEKPAPGQVRISIRAAALNHLDIWVRRGWPGLKLAFPHVLGSDAVGVVDALGAGVENVRIGDAVVVTPGFGCGHCSHCLDGEESLCENYRIYGENHPGLMAEQRVLPAEHVFPMPIGLSYAEAAAVPLAFLTAWHMLVSRAQVQAGEQVLVQAAGSGVGSAAIQIAKLWGARVIATASSEAKRALAFKLGADAVVDARKDNWHKEVRALSGGRGVDLVNEHVGGKIFEHSLMCLRAGGRLVSCGATIGATAQINLQHIFFKQLSIIGSTMGTRSELQKILDLVSSGDLVPVVHKVLPFAQAVEAQKLLEDRRAVGKVVLDFGSADQHPSNEEGPSSEEGEVHK